MNVLTKVLRYIRDARERRVVKDLQRREQWIEEARNAPSLEAWMNGIGR